MRQWKLTYELCDHFSQPVTGHFYSLRCFPRELFSQRVQSCQYEVTPCSSVSRGRDSFGNLLLSGHCEEPHEWLLVHMEAQVLTEDTPEPEPRPYYQMGMYRYGTAQTAMGEKLLAFYRALPRTDNSPPWKRTEALMKALHQNFTYRSGSTSFETKAEEAMSQRCGVCQDYAHILLALCRQEGMTARYVAGAIPGEGASHAWIEVWQDGFWKGFDPTNGRLAGEDYIRFAFGRDALDCRLSQGIFRGGGSQDMRVYLAME